MPVKIKIDRSYSLDHYRERTEPIKYIIIHCSTGNPEQQLQTLDQLGLSVHYIISKSGRLTSVIEPEKVAYHAGTSKWLNSQGQSLNGCSIGIEIECPDMGQRSTSYGQAASSRLCHLVEYLMYKYNIHPLDVLGHSDIAPTRKPDPGAGFPWKKLYCYLGLGTWYKDTRLSKSTDEKALLEKVGYDTSVMAAARYAFCRHFLPQEVMICDDIKQLLENPYPLDFVPKKFDHYMTRLRAVALAIQKNRALKYWYMKKE